MDLFNFSTDAKKIAGYIGYFNLGEWWLSEFSESERYDIQDRYMERYQNYRSEISLASGNLTSTDQTSVDLLKILSELFMKNEEHSIAYRMLKKAEELVDNDLPILKRHFFYSQMIEMYYKDRGDEASLGKAIEACHQQIALSEEAKDAFLLGYEDSPLPSHVGYRRLAIILEKQKKYQEAIDLCICAKEQGWSGDWEKRIERCRARL